MSVEHATVLLIAMESFFQIPLHLASERDTAEMVVFLLKYGADINKVDNDDKVC